MTDDILKEIPMPQIPLPEKKPDEPVKKDQKVKPAKMSEDLCYEDGTAVGNDQNGSTNNSSIASPEKESDRGPVKLPVIPDVDDDVAPEKNLNDIVRPPPSPMPAKDVSSDSEPEFENNNNIIQKAAVKIEIDLKKKSRSRSPKRERRSSRRSRSSSTKRLRRSPSYDERKKSRSRSRSRSRSPHRRHRNKAKKRSSSRRRRQRSESSSSRDTYEGLDFVMDESECVFKCKECHRGFYTIKEQAEHMIRAHDGAIPCSHCDKPAVSVTKLAAHVLFRHPTLKAKCFNCAESFGVAEDMDKPEWEAFREHVYKEVLKKKIHELTSKAGGISSSAVALRGVGQCKHGPAIKCKNFPNCPGAKCIYAHGQCRYDITCNKSSCPFDHTNRPRTCMACLNEGGGGGGGRGGSGRR